MSSITIHSTLLYITPFSSILFCFVLFFSFLFYFTLFCFFCSVLSSILFFFIPFHFILVQSILFCLILYSFLIIASILFWAFCSIMFYSFYIYLTNKTSTTFNNWLTDHRLSCAFWKINETSYPNTHVIHLSKQNFRTL